MSRKPKDHRPKIISFRASLDGLNIAARQSILWPCHAFSISIPQKKKSGLNVFEKTVLRITEIESGDTNKIASITCLEKELVSFIQNRLNQLGLVDNRYNLSGEGQELINEWQNLSDGNLEYTVATVFVDLLAGKLLPYVNTEQLAYKKIVKISDNGFVNFLINQTNEKTRVNSRQILPDKDSYWQIKPETNDIIKAIREFKKKYNQYALLNQNVDQYPPPVPMAEAISVHDNPELVYLHCSVLIQVGNSDLLITDGCGFGFSENFASYLMAQNWKWCADLKKKGVVDQIKIHSENPQIAKNIAWKYLSITRLFHDSKDGKSKGINTLLKELSYSPSTEAEEKEYIYKRQQIASKLHAALEWTLRFTISNYPVSEWEQIFISKNYKDNETLLCKFAEKIGFSVSKNNRSIFQVKPGAIRQIKHGKVELQPLLAIAITGAAQKYTDHPFHTLAAEHSGFIGFALQLKSLRDPIEHGDISDFEADQKDLNHRVQRLVQIIINLLPPIASELRQNSESEVDAKDDVNQERLKAEIELDKALGLSFVYEMSHDIKEQLIRVEMMLSQYAEDKAIEIIKCLASVIQLALFEVIINRKASGKFEGDIKDTAIRKIVESGFCSSIVDIPEQISTVNTKRIYRAAQGSSTTLGAHLLAIFLLCSERELTHLKNSDSTFLEFIANLISLRGHGNKQQHSFSRNDLESLKNNVFKAIKILTEI